MDAVSYSHSAKQAQRIEKFIKNPDSNSGIVTVPKVIGAGENVTIPAGRVAVLPNVQVDGTLNVLGDVFIPSGATFGDLESQIAERQLKSELAYDVGTSLYIPNTLTSGAIIDRGSNATGNYVKFADGTMICTRRVIISFTGLSEQSVTYPATFIDNLVFKTFDVNDYLSATGRENAQNVYLGGTSAGTEGKWNIRNQSSAAFNLNCSLMAIGKWK